MRLGQLARKLALRPDQIVEFLAKKNIQIEEGSNTKLEDDLVALLVEKFAPNGLDITPLQELPSHDVVEEIVSVTEPVEETEKIIIETIPVNHVDSEPLLPEEKTEVIKAPKVELTGLKVLGKIDLPEPKKKETSAKQAPSEPELKPQERKRPSQNKSSRATSRSGQNPVAIQREREEQEERQKREAARLLEKERRAQHYFNKVKVVTPVKTAKREEVIEEFADPMPQPKALLGKFFRWFRS